MDPLRGGTAAGPLFERLVALMSALRALVISGLRHEEISACALYLVESVARSESSVPASVGALTVAPGPGWDLGP
jgi:hypothetical protein